MRCLKNYSIALKGYAIELPNEAAAIAISKLPQVKWVEEHSLGGFRVVPPFTDPLETLKSVCRGKPLLFRCWNGRMDSKCTDGALPTLVEVFLSALVR